jgi:hypothetical protein
VDVQAHVQGYNLHPAVMDATLHLSMAALKPGSRITTRVPAGLAALRVHPMPNCQAATSIAHPQAPAADDSVQCSYRLLAEQHSCLELADLVARDVGPLPAAAQPAATADEIPEAELLYETQWQAVAAAQHTQGIADSSAADLVAALAGAHANKRTAQHTPTIAQSVVAANADVPVAVPTTSARVLAVLGQPAGSSPLQASHAVTRLLQLWQQCARRLAGGSMQLVTCGGDASMSSACRSGGGGRESASGLWALMRVAAAENPTAVISGVICDAARNEMQMKVCPHPKHSERFH